MGEIRKVIGKNIKEICALKGIRQVEIAEHLNVSQGSVSNWIKGTNSIDIENLAELCRFIGVSLDQIYGVAPLAPTVSLSKEETELLAVYRSLNSSGRELLLGSARAFSESPSTQKEEQNKTAM
ncbi:MAG: helix-turn-helix transcriptional regulator [Eubacteriales bacterium]|nr:helix-turn-helix transcriptional regulator [Eubacteriales bacterium]MDD4513767.1 helix-turn-helix transcriptional regulator [Eubacteriales bacterium]